MILVFTVQGHLPLWVALIVLSRDVIILVGAAAYRRWFERVGNSPAVQRAYAIGADIAATPGQISEEAKILLYGKASSTTGAQ